MGVNEAAATGTVQAAKALDEQLATKGTKPNFRIWRKQRDKSQAAIPMARSNSRLTSRYKLLI